jgi:hypothetical protein
MRWAGLKPKQLDSERIATNYAEFLRSLKIPFRDEEEETKWRKDMAQELLSETMQKIIALPYEPLPVVLQEKARKNFHDQFMQYKDNKAVMIVHHEDADLHYATLECAFEQFPKPGHGLLFPSIPIPDEAYLTELGKLPNLTDTQQIMLDAGLDFIKNRNEQFNTSQSSFTSKTTPDINVTVYNPRMHIRGTPPQNEAGSRGR